MDAPLPPDWREFYELLAHEVRFVVVGALAVAAHAEPRFTEDLDILAEPSLRNAGRLRSALIAFGFGEAVPPATELAKAGPIWMLGRKLCASMSSPSSAAYRGHRRGGDA